MSAILETDFLLLLGERVRAWRAAHSTTRKALAASSGVSERFLAQLEAGGGHSSALRLRQLAGAMTLPLETLVREEAPPKKDLIALVGLRGAGKSTLGEKLAEALDMAFIELDREVEKEAGARLGEVF